MENSTKKHRSKGSGTILKRGRIYYLQYMVNGHIKKISLKCTSRREAEIRAKELLSPLQAADTTEKVALHIAHAKRLVKAGKTPLAAVWELYLESHNRPDSSQGTLQSYKSQWKRFRKWIEKNYPNVVGLEQINEDIAKRYAADLWSDGLAGRTYNNHIKALMLITRILSERAGISSNPWFCITRKNEYKLSRKEFTKEQVKDILAVFDDKDFKIANKEEMRVLFNIGIWTGLRLIDCATLKWTDIDMERNLINCIPVKTRKTNRSVTIPIHPSLKKALLDAREWKQNEFVLPVIAGNYDKSYILHQNIKRVFKQAGFDDISYQGQENSQRKRKANMYGFHSFRHTFVSFCAKAGVPLPVVQAIVGHSHPAITRHYIHLGEDSIKQAIAALPEHSGDNLLENKPTPEDKLEKILSILKDKKDLSERERIILELVSGK